MLLSGSKATGADAPACGFNSTTIGWLSILLASLILLITMGIRQTVGLFVDPIVSSTVMNIAQVSMAFALGQLVWGLAQPFFGAWVDKKGAFSALVVGALFIAAGQLGSIWADSMWSLTIMQGILSPAGSAAGSFSVLIAIVMSRLNADKRSMAGGIVNAGGSLGQFLFAPMVQFVMNARDHYAGFALLAFWGLISILPAWLLCRIKPAPAIKDAVPGKISSSIAANGLVRESLRDQLKVAVRNSSYMLLCAGFFTCGFHVAFLTTHLPGEISSCGHAASVSAASLSIIGLCNIAGSLGAGFLGKYFRMKYILTAMYASRALMIFIYLLADKTEFTFYAFAVATGLTWLATVPPTAGIIGKLFGMRYFATLFGIAFLVHQVGGFLGAFLGGIAMQYEGSYLWVWHIDVVLALGAAIFNLPIKEEAVH